MIYNAQNRIKANRIQKAQNLAAFALVYALLLVAGHLEYEDHKLEQVSYTVQP